MLGDPTPEEIARKKERQRVHLLRETYRRRPYVPYPDGKQCVGCRKLLPQGLFSSTLVKGKRYYHARCIKCRATYYAKTKVCREKRALVESLRDKPCADCQQKFAPSAMQFWLKTGIKKFCVSMAWAGRSRQAILDEATKYEIVCANCACIRKMDANGRKARSRATLAELHPELGKQKEIAAQLTRLHPRRPQASQSQVPALPQTV